MRFCIQDVYYVLLGYPEQYIEKEWLLRIADGDEVAFTKLFDRYGRILHPFIRQLLKTDELARDGLQQVFLKLWLKRDVLATVESPRAYIFKLASNECLMHRRRQVVERRHLAEAMYQWADARDEGRESTLAVADIQTLVQHAFLQLPPQQQRIYRLSRHDHLSITEISERLDLAPGTVKNSLTLSLKTIRTLLEKEGYLLPVVLIGAFL